MATTLEKTPEQLTWRERMEITPGRHRPNRVRNGAIFVVLALIFLWIIYTKPSLPFVSGGGQKLTAEFGYGANVRPGYTPVRVHGVDVGQVTAIQRSDSGRGVRVEMLIDDGKGVRLHNDASVALRWRTLLGRNMYVDLNTGSPSAPALREAVIPMARTSSQVELDTALEPLDVSGRAATKTMVTQFDRAVSSPRQVGDTISAVAPAMRPLARGLAAVRGTTPGQDLPHLVTRTNRAIAALARDEAALGGVIDNGSVALGATAARRADLAATVNTAPAALQETRATMTRLRATLAAADPVVAKLTPGAAKLDAAAARTQAALRTAVPLLRDLRPTLRDLRPAVKDLNTVATTGTPAFAPINSTMDRVHGVFLPWLHATNSESKRPNYQNIGPTVASVDSATSFGDRNGPVANFLGEAAGPNSLVNSPCKLYVWDPATAQKVQCELLTRALAAVFTGTKPQDVKLRDSAVSADRLAPYLTGKAKLIPNPKLKPLHVLPGGKK